MVEYISPGTYLQEQDESTFVQNASPLRPGIVLRAPWGPYNTVTEVTTAEELFLIFGVPSSSNYVGMLGTKECFRVMNNIKVVRAESASDVKASYIFDDDAAADSLKLEALYAGEGGNHVSVKISTETAGKRIDIYFYGAIVETYTGLAKASGTDKNLNYKAAINGISEYVIVDTDATCDANAVEPADIAATSLTGGSDTHPTAAEFQGTDETEGLKMFTSDTLYVNVLLCPDSAKLVAEADIKAVGVEITSIVTSRKDSLGLVDGPAGMSIAEVRTFKTTTAAYNSSYTAFYWSWITIYSATIAAEVAYPGSIAGLYVLAQSDAIANSWYAAAGYNRAVIAIASDIEVNPGQASRELLYGDQINYLVKEPGVGVVVMGNKTTQTSSSALQSLHIRRMLLAAKKLVKTIGDTLLMGPNDEITESKMIARCNQILSNIAAKRGLNDFRVASITQATDRDNGVLKFHIKLKPTPASEIIYATFQIVNQTTSFED